MKLGSEGRRMGHRRFARKRPREGSRSLCRPSRPLRCSLEYDRVPGGTRVVADRPSIRSCCRPVACPSVRPSVRPIYLRPSLPRKSPGSPEPSGGLTGSGEFENPTERVSGTKRNHK